MRLAILRQPDGSGALQVDGPPYTVPVHCNAPAGHYALADLVDWDALGITLATDDLRPVLEIGFACAKVLGNELVTLDITDAVVQAQGVKDVTASSPTMEETDHG